MFEIDRTVSRPVKTGMLLEGESGNPPPVFCLKVAYQGESYPFVPPFGTYELPDECFGLIGSDVVLVIEAVRSLMKF